MIGGRRVGAVVPAAGSGSRLGPGEGKVFRDLAGTPMLVRTLRALERSRCLDDVVVVLRPGDLERAERLIADAGCRKVRNLVPGGGERQESVRLGVAALAPTAPSVVVIHDAARPFVEPELVDETARAAADSGAAAAAVRPKDTVKVESEPGGRVTTPVREGCWLAQTPQAFRTELLLEALARAAADGFVGTDDASLLERLGARVTLLEGSYRNIKITTPEDLEIGEILAAGGVPRRTRS